MPRYIDADALKAKYEQMIPEIGDGYHKETLQDVLFELDYAPTISPDEVRGVGKWIEDEEQNNVELTFHCSECGRKAVGRFEKTRYCGDCGAMMEVSEDV